MKRIFDIAINDMTQTLRDRLTFMFLLIMPVLFTLLFGFAFGGAAAMPGDSRLAVGFLDQDQSQLSGELKSTLQRSTLIRLEESAGLTVTGLDQVVTSAKLSGALIVPAGFGIGLQNGAPLKLELIATPNSGADWIILGAAQTAAGRLESAVKAAQITRSLGGSFEAGLVLALKSWQNAPVSIKSTSAAALKDEKLSAGVLSKEHSAPGMMLQFGIAGLLTAAQVLVAERKSGCLQRLLTTPAARGEILLGHFLAIFSVIFAQFVLLIGFGQIVMGLNYLRLPLGTMIMALTSAMFIAGLGLLIGTLAENDDQAVIFAMIPMFVFSGLGGAWVPLEVTGETFRLIGHLTPVAWAMDGFQNILTRGLDLNSIWLPAGALLGYAVLFAGLAAWRFRSE
ncbi:MAG: ABC transporter permease [Desulfobacterales bacterium]|nr:ABC transporter permease [Desulfobacterales bacterium]